MRRLGADREEKRVTRGTIRSGRKKQETLDLTNPNQRREACQPWRADRASPENIGD
jgi:hypothetical protein